MMKYGIKINRKTTTAFNDQVKPLLNDSSLVLETTLDVFQDSIPQEEVSLYLSDRYLEA